ncbi:MAG: hypothetical protein GY913_22950, partial [Proteobacteria bacterium]|nr:hypothetical protein [Pseudomonadota bacterium]
DFAAESVAVADARIALANIEDLANVDTSGLTNGQVLKWSGTAWTPVDEIGGLDAIELTDISVTTIGTPGTAAATLTYDNTTGLFSFTPADMDDKSDVGHTHTLSDITDSGTAAPLDVAASGDATSGQVVKGDDSRLSDARTPVSHTHVAAEVTDFDAAADARIAAASVGDMSDVDLSSVAAGATVKWNGTAFETVDLFEAADITITTLPAGTGALTWNSTSSQFNYQPVDISGKSDVGHTHVVADVTDYETATAARADARIAAASIDDVTDVDISTAAPTSGQVLSWDGSAFTPATPTELGDISVTTQAAGTNALTFDDATGVLDFTPTDLSGKSDVGHTHVLADVTDAGTVAGLDVAASGDAASGEVVKGDDTRLTDARTPTAHTHVLADVTDAGSSAGLDVAASGDAASGEVVKGDDTRLTDARTPVSHTHAQSEVTNLVTDLAAKADLVAGKVPTSQLPDIAISEFLGSVASQAAQTGLTGEVGDWCIRTDESKTYIISANNGSSYSDWTQIATPSAPVDSVNGQVGVVVLGPTDVGAAAASHTHVLADVTDAGTAASFDAPASGDAGSGELVKGDDSRLSDARTPVAHTHVLADVTDSGTAAALDVAASGDAGSGEVVKGDDSRLTDARTPVSHTHTASEVTDFVAEAQSAADTQIAAASIGDMADVDTTPAATTGQALVWNGSEWAPADASDPDAITLGDLSAATAAAGTPG